MHYPERGASEVKKSYKGPAHHTDRQIYPQYFDTVEELQQRRTTMGFPWVAELPLGSTEYKKGQLSAHCTQFAAVKTTQGL